jgi:hypothetical protein
MSIAAALDACRRPGAPQRPTSARAARRQRDDLTRRNGGDVGDVRASRSTRSKGVSNWHDAPLSTPVPASVSSWHPS